MKVHKRKNNKKSCITKINEILDQKDLTRWFEMEPTEEEMKGPNRKSIILGYVGMTFVLVILFIYFLTLQELGEKILYGILWASSVWAIIYSVVRSGLKKKPRGKTKTVIKCILIITKYLCFIAVILLMFVEWAFFRLNLTYTYKYLGRIFMSMLYIFDVMIAWWILFCVGTAKWNWFSGMSDLSISFWFWLMLLIILLIGMRIFAWRVTKELPEEDQTMVKKELLKELQALANIVIIGSYIYIFGTDSQGILREGYLHAVEVWILMMTIGELTIRRDVDKSLIIS